jgi:hypothetical protein
MLNKFVYDVDNIVIGSGLNAVLFAYINNFTLINNEFRIPFRFDFFGSTVNSYDLSIPRHEVVLQGREEKISLGVSKRDAYKHLLFVMSLSGLNPLSDRVISIRLEDKNTLKAITGKTKINFKYKKLHIFDDKNIHGLPDKLEDLNKNLYKIMDWIDVKSCTTHPYEYFETSDDFVNEVFLYPSERIDGNHKNRKDVVAVSYLTEEQLQDYEYSDTYAKFKVLNIMKDAGIRGARNGRDMLDKTKYKYYALKIECAKREVISLQKTLYEDTENIEFVHHSEDDIISKFLVDDKNYSYKINKKMNWDEYRTK